MSTMPDRFYLNSIGRHSDIETETDSPNYVLHRGHYMQKILEEDVKCIILSTYGLNADSALSELHCLLNKKPKVPTLIIHGDKRKALNDASNARRRCRFNKRCIRSEDQTDDITKLVAGTEIKGNSVDDNKRFSNAMRSSDDSEVSPPTSTKVSARCDFNEYSNHVHIKRVEPSWLYPQNRSNVNPPLKTPSSSSTSDVQFVMKNSIIKPGIMGSPKKRNDRNDSFGGYVAGVHHPKYVLAFTSKGVHILIG